jgi:inorganic pyrophosphatase
MRTGSSPTRFQAHPWHGIELGPRSPEVIRCYIEIVPTDVVKYEIDKESGHLCVDRPNKYSNQSPTLYGFAPQTFCGEAVGRYCSEKTGRAEIEGDGDPLDICVLSERPISHGGVLVYARPIGGLRMIDRGQADDKIIAVLEGDAVYGDWKELADCSTKLIDRLHHYFLTYKQLPGIEERKVEIAATYSRDEAHQVIRASVEDYQALCNR